MPPHSRSASRPEAEGTVTNSAAVLVLINEEGQEAFDAIVEGGRAEDHLEERC
jgi:hypothetical protein